MSAHDDRQTMRIDLTALPAEHVIEPDIGGGLLFMLFGLFLGGGTSVLFVSFMLDGEFEPSLFFFAILGLVMLFLGIKTMTSKITIKIDENMIEYSQSTLFERKYWSEALENYIGVASRTEFYSGGKNNPSYTLYIVELRHLEKEKTIHLYRSREEVGFRKILEDYCRQLNMNAIEGEGEDAVIRNVEDLDKSVAELAAEGKVEIEFDPSEPPPAGIKVRMEREGLNVILPKMPISTTVTTVVITFAVFMIYIGLFVARDLMFLVPMGALIGIAMTAISYWSRVVQTVIILSDEKIRFYCDTPWGKLMNTMVPVAEIETVRIGKKTDNSASVGVLLITDRETNIVGEGLPRPALEWLKNCILASLTRKIDG